MDSRKDKSAKLIGSVDLVYEDCDRDSECYGPLECFQRTEDNPNQPVPGCLGLGDPGSDYCYLPGDEIIATSDTQQEEEAAILTPPTFAPTELPTSDNQLDHQQDDSENQEGSNQVESVLANQFDVAEVEMSLRSEIRTCSEQAPCGPCEGDCDDDSDCSDFLVCFQRQWYQPYLKVPGCAGRGVAGMFVRVDLITSTN